MSARILFLVWLPLATLLCGCKVESSDTAPSGPQVKGESIKFASAAVPASIVTEPVALDSNASLTLSGRIVWDEDRTVRIFNPFAGRVQKILVKLGDSVSAGQPLAILTSPDYGTAQADFRKASAAQLLTQHSLERARDLNAHGVIAAKEVEQAEADAASAEAETQRAASVLKLFGDTGGIVNQQLVLRSPIDGVVVERNINPGQELRIDTAGAPQFVVTDPAYLWVQLDARESDLTVLKIGTAIDLRAGPYPRETFKGELFRVSDYVDPISRTLKVLGRVENVRRQLKGEMYVTASVPLSQQPQPQAAATAVFLTGDKYYSFVRDGDTFVRREVTVGSSRGGRITIFTGVRPREQVVTQGALYLQQLLQTNGQGAGA